MRALSFDVRYHMCKFNDNEQTRGAQRWLVCFNYAKALDLVW